MITIDQTGRVPIYEQICRSVCRDIANGFLKEGDMLPSARALAKQLSLNPNTVAKAYSRLEHDEIIYSVAGKGCFVAKPRGEARDKLMQDFRAVTAEALENGATPEELIELVNQIEKERAEQ